MKLNLSLSDFFALREIIYKFSGVWFEEKKLYLVQSRVETRLKELNLSNISDYIRMLKYEDSAQSEILKFMNELTTNETYFFRDFPQIQNFADDILPIIADQRRNDGSYTINIWSAACSSGDEPYTLAIILCECLDDIEKWRIKIDATDINSEVLQKARKAIYSERAVKEIPRQYLNKYFTKKGSEYQLSHEISSRVNFSLGNLSDRLEMRARRESYDIVFCRNVLIYFDDKSCRNVLSGIYDSLKPSGFVFLGYSEQVGRFSNAFNMVKIGDRIVYQKPTNIRKAG